jgi:hypothetical protein
MARQQNKAAAASGLLLRGGRMSEVLVALTCTFFGIVIGWVACSWHWHTRLAESWGRLRAATWRRRTTEQPVITERALDVGDVTEAFGYGFVAESEPNSDTRDQLTTGQDQASVPPGRSTAS